MGAMRYALAYHFLTNRSNSMKTYFVTKTVQMLFTIQANDADHAERIIQDYYESEADSSTILNIVAESSEEYEANLND